MRALLDPAVAELIASGALERLETPVHVLLPEVFERNIDAFRKVLDDRRLAHRLCYAHKVNHAKAFVVAARKAGIGIDVSSPGELAGALAAGFAPASIEATGPKGEAMLRHLLKYAGLTVNVDNPWELAALARLAPRPVPILLRLAAGRRVSRFGFAPDEIAAALDLIAGERRLDLRGVAFHLDTADRSEKVSAIDQALRVLEQAVARGLDPGVLDIGGGYRQAFVAHPAEVDAYVRQLILPGWGGATFGLRREGDHIFGTPVFERYRETVTGADALADLLDAPLRDGRTVAETVRENLLELWIEPGKSLVDRAGLTVAGVEFTKRAPDGRRLVVLDLSRDKITAADQEVFLDPILISGGDSEPGEFFLAGNLCLERDMISNHPVVLPRTPRPGDRLVFVNTAAYQMDLSASEALQHPRPPKVVFRSTPEGGWACSSDTSPT